MSAQRTRWGVMFMPYYIVAAIAMLVLGICALIIEDDNGR